MKRLLILSTLAIVTSTSLGCCGMGGMGGCFGRHETCSPCEEPMGEPCGCQRCNSCEGGGYMSAPVMSAPATTITPGPAYSTGYLPR
ncbi:MAG TPA: hypothetical protein VGJ15_10160 [Pirellulales bacterium]